METQIFESLIILIIGILSAILAHLVIRWMKIKAEYTPTQLDNIILESVDKPVVVTILATTIYAAVSTAGLIPALLWGIETTRLTNAFFIIIEAWIAAIFVGNIIHTYGTKIAEKTKSDFDQTQLPLLEKIVSFSIWFIALMLIFYEFQVNITPFLAGAGIVSIAVAFAAQTLLSNFIGGAIITVDQPFKIGDRIKFGDFLGDVIDIGARSTRIKTLDNQIVILPNAKVTSDIVVNYSQPDPLLKVRVPFSVAYGSDMDRVQVILLEIAREAAEKTPWVLSVPEPLVYFLEFGESSLNGQMLLWTGDFNYSWDVLHYVNIRINERFKEEGIEIPFKQVDIRMRKN
ncbi:MAG: mechanosensitive ion channel family protein [Methanoregula sp.]|jgi:small-conductance mechanosensitive channel